VDAEHGGPYCALLWRSFLPTWLVNGSSSDFNKARLFLIAKTDSCWQDTRPISVTDAATGLWQLPVEAVTPAL
jgi:hypothetical protein